VHGFIGMMRSTAIWPAVAESSGTSTEGVCARRCSFALCPKTAADFLERVDPRIVGGGKHDGVAQLLAGCVPAGPNSEYTCHTLDEQILECVARASSRTAARRPSPIARRRLTPAAALQGNYLTAANAWVR